MADLGHLLFTFGLFSAMYAQESKDVPAYNTLMRETKNNIILFGSGNLDQPVKQRTQFKDNLIKIMGFFREPEDIIGYLKELLVNLESILRWGNKQESKDLIKRMIDEIDELRVGVNENYRDASPAIRRLQDVIDTFYTGLLALAKIAGIDKNPIAQRNEESNKKGQQDRKCEDLYVVLYKNQMLSFSDKTTTQTFIKNFKKIIAEIYGLGSDSVKYLKNFSADLEGIMNTGFSDRTKDIVAKGIERLKDSIENAFRSSVESNEWYVKLVALLRTVVTRLENDYRKQILELGQKVQQSDSRAPQEIYNQSKQSDSASAQIAAHLELVLSNDRSSYENFFSKMNMAIPAECKIDAQKSFMQQWPIVWPCKMRYVTQIVKTYHPDALAEVQQLDSIVLKLVLFIKNQYSMDSSRIDEKLNELKQLVEPIKNPKKLSIWDKFKAILPGKKKDVQKIVDELKKAVVRDVDSILSRYAVARA